MRKALLFLILGLYFLPANASTTYLNFEVEAPQKTKIQIKMKKPDSEEFNIFMIDLKSDNKVSTVVEIQNATFADIQHDLDEFRVYLKPGDDIYIKFLANAAQTTLSFSGKGAKDNQLLADYESRYKTGGHWDYEASYIKTSVMYKNYERSEKSPAEYYRLIGQENQEQLAFLLEKKNKEDISPNIIEYISNDIKYTYETQKIAYLIINQKRMGPGDFERVANHYQLKKDANTISVDLMNHPAYFNYVHAYAHFLFLPKKTNSVAVELQYYNKIDEHMSGRAKYYLLSKLIRNVYTYEGTTDLAKKKFAGLKKECPYEEYILAIEQLYGDLIIEMPDIDAPDFIVRDENGIGRSLSNYRGQVVYVSFWAHWCKPCIRNFEKSVQLRAQLKKMGVVLLNVSIDDLDEQWKTALAKHDIYGYNVIAQNVDEVKQLYGLSTLPAYYIINKKGKFAYLSDEENRDILQEFRDLVNE